MIRSLLLSLFLALGLIGNPPTPSQKEINHAAMHRVEISSYDDDGAYCTAEAIGPHAVLTAAHCLVDKPWKPGSVMLITVDADTDHETIAYAGEMLFDNNDHVIIELQHPNFHNGFSKFTAWMDTEKRSSPIEGSIAYYYGSPKMIECADCYREGVVMGAFVNPKTKQHGFWYAMATVHGDSGAAIFDDQDRLIGVVSMTDGEGGMGAYNLQFTADQWKTAVLY